MSPYLQSRKMILSWVEIFVQALSAMHIPDLVNWPTAVVSVWSLDSATNSPRLIT